MQVEAEVSRLEELKASKMKELVFKKKTELEELRRRTHLVAEADTEVETAIESGNECHMAHLPILKNLMFRLKRVTYAEFSYSCFRVTLIKLHNARSGHVW